MVVHLLLQFPLLAIVGVLLSTGLPAPWRAKVQAFNGRGIPGILLAVFSVLYWMLPRSLDAALTGWEAELAKFVSLPLLVGVPLALSWSRLPGVGKGFVVAHLLAMLLVLGWLYLQAPIRLCNNYLLGEQAILGHALLWLAGVIAFYWVAKLFTGSFSR